MKPSRPETICKCGCGKSFFPFPIYKKRHLGGGLYYPEYIRGHNPKCKKTTFGNMPAWNKGKKKGDHPSLDRMGFRSGHEPYCNWDHLNKRLKNDPELRKKWLESKQGQLAWNKGLTASTHPDKIKRGKDHFNWKGNPGGIRETYEYGLLRTATFARDNYTCTECGDHGYKGRGKSVRLHMHHIVAFCHDRSRVLDPTNVTTLCEDCHRKTENFGSKAMLLKRKLKPSGK